MNKKTIKAGVLVLVFLVSLIGLSFLTDTNQINLTSEMKEATLPVVYLQKGNVYINELFGYKGEMDAISIRDTITPLDNDMVLPVTIQAFENHVEGISYQVRTMDMERLLEEKQVADYSQKNGEIITEFQIQNLLEEEQEYRLIITLECNGEEIRYYTRIIYAEACYMEDAIEFAMDFHAKSFDPQGYRELATYLEPNSEGDNTTLQKVTIHSSLSQVAWADFEGEVLKEPIPSIKEIGSTYYTIVLNYIMAAKGTNGETEFYNVEEYYRVRYSDINDRMYLLDYERTMNEIFRGSGENFTDTALLLGIRDQEISYRTNESASVISFVQEGDLWSYNSNNDQLSLVFSFRGIEGLSDRANHQDYDIRIIRVSESGSIDFVVYGYMNRGEHEGYTGIGVYHYDSVANTVQEELFVQSKESYQVLKETWGKLFYTSAESCFYMIAEGNLYRIPLNGSKEELMQEGLTEGSFAVSEEGRYVAWREAGSPNVLTVTDLEMEEQWQITGSADEILQPVGFIESDFVYGIGMETEDTSTLLRKIIIVDNQQQIIKEYEKEGYFITDAYVENSTVFLGRAWKNGNSYTAVEADAIKSHEIEAAQSVRMETMWTEQKQTQVKLTADLDFGEATPQVLTPKEVVVEQKQILAPDVSPQSGRYYVWVAGEVILSTNKVAEAVRYADERAGVVLQDNQSYLWCRGRRSSISMAGKVLLSAQELEQNEGAGTRCLLALLQAESTSFDVEGLINAGETAEDILQEAMPEAKVLNLTGCSLSQVLYYVGQGNLVFTEGANQAPLLIVGYDELNVILYNPLTNSTYKKGLKDGEEFFHEAGNIFISYLKE